MFAAAVLALPACISASDPADLGSNEQEIIGGTTAAPTDYPSVVGVEFTPGDWFCSGTLIADQWVLTAAHCVLDEQTLQPETDPMHVRFGATEINSGSGGTVVAVAEVHYNPGYNGDAWDNDIALLKLAAPVTNVTPSPLYRTQLATGSTVTEVGYGASSNNQHSDGAGLLRKVDKTTVACSGANDPTILDANLVCMNAGDGSGSCYGDSGGPAFFMSGGVLTVAGVTSGGNLENCGEGFDLYTSVAAEIAWVDTTMGATDPGTGSGSDGTGSGSGGGSGDDGVDTHHDGGGGCSTSGSSGSLAFIGLAAIAIVRRRRK
ncbi:MAG TPA: serine protease [Kofleriaceae bacterium]